MPWLAILLARLISWGLVFRGGLNMARPLQDADALFVTWVREEAVRTMSAVAARRDRCQEARFGLTP